MKSVSTIYPALTAFFLVLALLSATPAQDAAAGNTKVRQWESVSGALVEAEFVRLEGALVHLKLPNNDLIAVRLSRLVERDRKIAEQLAVAAKSPEKDVKPPPKPKPGIALGKLLGKSLVDTDGSRSSTGDMEAELIGLYFAAYVSRPCRIFTPKLRSFYSRIKGKKLPFEIVFISFDETEQNMRRHMETRTMPWPAIPFGSRSIKQLQEKYGVRMGGLPQLIIVDPTGKIISTRGHIEVESAHAKAFDQWSATLQEQVLE
jgi:hypothetical protein